MIGSSDPRERLEAKLRDISVVNNPTITGETEICYDLSILGWDLWDFLEWITDEFGTDFSAMKVGLYSPGEGAFMGLYTLTGRRKYRSLRLADLLAAIEAGRWSTDDA